MAGPITTEIVECFLNCRYKALLRLTGEAGLPSAFELFERQRKSNAVGRARQALEAATDENVTLTTSLLAHGADVIFGASFLEPELSFHFDAVRKVEGTSQLGEFHYEPVLIVPCEKIAPDHKLLLGVQAIGLGMLQGRRPTTGVIVHGDRGRQARVTLPLVRAEAILGDLRRVHPAPPRMVLNDHCQVCEFQERCHAQALKDDDVSLLRGLAPKEIHGYNRRGILTLSQLSRDFRPKRGKARSLLPRRHPALQAMAIRDKRVLVLGSGQVPDSPVRVYLDLEGDPDRGFVYLLGMIVEQNGAATMHSFWIDRKEDEKQLVNQLVEVLAPYDDFCVFHYGSYETTFLRRMAKEVPALCSNVLPRCCNVLSVIYHHVYFPTFSNSLKEIGHWLGYSWRSREASGIQSLIWRRTWEEAHDPATKECLLAYNQDDCAALRYTTEFVRRALTGEALAASSDSGQQVVNVEDLSVQSRKTEWNKRSPFFPDFDFINKCGYFDYQRDRVFARTNETLSRLRKKKRLHKRSTYRLNRKVELRLKRCPICNRLLQKLRDQVRHKIILDLRVTSGGITRRVTRYSAAIFRCGKCKLKNRPDTFLRLARHGLSLRSWVLYQHLVHRTSFSRIGEMCAELFGLRVHSVDVMEFKTLAAAYYQPTYDAMLTRLVWGFLLHADETQVKLRNGVKAYVWVFASMEDVIYMLRPNREGTFLKEMLGDFRGVLVSDFYRAYDSVECAKQKCLIHLMRDLNNDLLKSPFDEEFKTIVSAFAALLKAIVTTIDKRGLKRKWLAKHVKDVARFFESLEVSPCSSEVAEGYRTRFLRHRDALFTFLDHDGIPWNNSNAEHAIRRFAQYRDVSENLLNETGLTQYLVLLSILQTCRCRGIEFLPFLLSGETDMVAYVAGPRKRNYQDTLDLYPEWFMKNRRKKVVAAETPVRDGAVGTGGPHEEGKENTATQAELAGSTEPDA